jgi:hypothetical protein
MVDLWGRAVSYERGTPYLPLPLSIWALETGVSGIFPAPQLTDSYRVPSLLFALTGLRALGESKRGPLVKTHMAPG